MTQKYTYEVICFNSGASVRLGDDREVYGLYTSVQDANRAIIKLYDELKGIVERDNWTRGQEADGRLWLNCDDHVGI